MIGLGTIINIACIIFGGIVGLLCGKKLTERFQNILMTALGVAVIFIGIAGVLEKMLVIKDGALSSTGAMMLIVSLVLGAFIGELINIDAAIEKFGVWLKIKTKSEGENGFVSGFVDASCTVCIGAMAIIGAINDGIYRNPELLIAKGLLDMILVCIMSSFRGKGPIFSAIPVLVLQGGVTIASIWLGSFIPDAALYNLSYVGSALIACIGINLLFDKRIKVANLLPSIIIAALWIFV